MQKLSMLWLQKQNEMPVDLCSVDCHLALLLSLHVLLDVAAVVVAAAAVVAAVADVNSWVEYGLGSE